MKEKIKVFNPILIISNVLMLVSVTGCLFTKENILKIMISLYWLSITLNIIGIILFIGTWTKGGINIDKKKSKSIFNGLDDLVLGIIVCYTLFFLGIVFVGNMSIEFRNNIYLIIGFYILTIIIELFLYIIEEKTYKETKKLVQETIKQKK